MTGAVMSDTGLAYKHPTVCRMLSSQDPLMIPMGDSLLNLLAPEEIQEEKCDLRVLNVWHELTDDRKVELQDGCSVKTEPQVFELESQSVEVMKASTQETVMSEMILPDCCVSHPVKAEEPVATETENRLPIYSDPPEVKNEPPDVEKILMSQIVETSVNTEHHIKLEPEEDGFESTVIKDEEEESDRNANQFDTGLTMIGSTPKRKKLTLREKVELIRKSEGKTHRTLAQEFKIGRTQVGCILKRKAELMEAYENEANPDRKHQFQNSPYTQIDTIVFEWFSRLQSLYMPVTGPMIQTKALDVARALNQPDFKASGSWLSRFKSRHLIGGNRVNGEKSTVTQETNDNWHECFPSFLEEYNPRDIYNMGETGVFYRALPDKTLAVKESDVSCGKKSMEHLTVALCVNQLGEFQKPLVIGKSPHQCCFWNLDIHKLPVIWHANKKAWMTTILFEEWVKDFNHCMLIQGRKVILLLDSAPSHLHDLQLSNVKLVFLPANGTSCLQPLGRGIFQAVKLQYRQRLLQHVITMTETEADPQAICRSIDVHLALTWIQAAVHDVKPTMVQKCFKKTGIPHPTDTPTADPPADPAEDEDNVLLTDLIHQTTSALNLPEPMSAEEYVAMDDSCPTHEPLDDGWENHLMQETTAAPTEPQPVSGDEAEPVPTRQLTDGEAQSMLTALRVHFLQKNYSQSLDLLMATQQQFQVEKFSRCTSEPVLDRYIRHVKGT